MTVIIDASVAAKWFFPENLHTAALDLLQTRPDELEAPALLLAEVANLAWKKARRGEASREQAQTAVLQLPDCVPVLHPPEDLVDLALDLALALDHPVYDCLYLACAEARDAPLVTADRRLCSAVTGSPLAGRVVPLGEAAT